MFSRIICIFLEFFSKFLCRNNSFQNTFYLLRTIIMGFLAQSLIIFLIFLPILNTGYSTFTKSRLSIRLYPFNSNWCNRINCRHRHLNQVIYVQVYWEIGKVCGGVNQLFRKFSCSYFSRKLPM